MMTPTPTQIWTKAPRVTTHAAIRFAERVLKQPDADPETLQRYLEALWAHGPFVPQWPDSNRTWHGLIHQVPVVYSEARHRIITVLRPEQPTSALAGLMWAWDYAWWIGAPAVNPQLWEALPTAHLQAIEGEWTVWNHPQWPVQLWVHDTLRLMQWGGPVEETTACPIEQPPYDDRDDRRRAIKRRASFDCRDANGVTIGEGWWMGRTPLGFVVVINPAGWIQAAWRPGMPIQEADRGQGVPDWEALWRAHGQPRTWDAWHAVLRQEGWSEDEFQTTYWGGWNRLKNLARSTPFTEQELRRYYLNWQEYLRREPTKAEYQTWIAANIHQAPRRALAS